MNRQSSVNEEMFLELYHTGMPPAEMSKSLGVTYNALTNWMKRKGHYRLCPEYEQKARNMYDAGASDVEIAEAVNCNASTVSYWREKHNLPKRRRVKCH